MSQHLLQLRGRKKLIVNTDDSSGDEVNEATESDRQPVNILLLYGAAYFSTSGTS